VGFDPGIHNIAVRHAATRELEPVNDGSVVQLRETTYRVSKTSLLWIAILYIIFPTVCSYALTLYPATARLRCCDRYIRCHRLLAVKPLSPKEHAGRRVGKGGTLGSVQTTAVLIRPETYDNGLLLAVRDDSKLMYVWCQLTQ